MSDSNDNLRGNLAVRAPASVPSARGSLTRDDAKVMGRVQ
jgi:hypothetical protein